MFVTERDVVDFLSKKDIEKIPGIIYTVEIILKEVFMTTNIEVALDTFKENLFRNYIRERKLSNDESFFNFIKCKNFNKVIDELNEEDKKYLFEYLPLQDDEFYGDNKYYKVVHVNTNRSIDFYIKLLEKDHILYDPQEILSATIIEGIETGRFPKVFLENIKLSKMINMYSYKINSNTLFNELEDNILSRYNIDMSLIEYMETSKGCIVGRENIENILKKFYCNNKDSLGIEGHFNIRLVFKDFYIEREFDYDDYGQGYYWVRRELPKMSNVISSDDFMNLVDDAVDNLISEMI